MALRAPVPRSEAETVNGFDVDVFVAGVNAPLMCSYYTVAVWRVVRGWTGVACVAMVYLIFAVGLFCEARVGGALSSAMYAKVLAKVLGGHSYSQASFLHLGVVGNREG